MGCRDDSGTRALTALATVVGRADRAGVRKMFRALVREGRAVSAPAPAPGETAGFLAAVARDAATDARLAGPAGLAVRVRLADALADALADRPGPTGPVFHAWLHVVADCSNVALVRRVADRPDDGTWTLGPRPVRSHWDIAREQAARGVGPGGSGRVLARDLVPGDVLAGDRPTVVTGVGPPVRGKVEVWVRGEDRPRLWGASTPVAVACRTGRSGRTGGRLAGR